ncbi:hypothetical protein [Salipiger abyssi]|uniref:hypothetical protein n=1 Tax=Salipiger abyssi TaxID=1250539 RepID=UPI00405970C8
MPIMRLSSAVLILGLAIVAVYPLLGPVFGTAPVDATQVADAPWWLMPVGYFAAFIGAAGLFIGWARKKEKTR